jgi:hypothetical protein
VTTDDDDDEMNEMMVLTEEGLDQLVADEDGTARLDPRDALSMEVLRQVGECTGWELEKYCDELVAAYGGDAKALAALRNGKAGFAKIN